MSPGTNILASMFCQVPSRLAVATGFKEALSAATASAALMVSYLQHSTAQREESDQQKEGDSASSQAAAGVAAVQQHCCQVR
jgi:hypothetical protein